jgi:hypothetical protein
MNPGLSDTKWLFAEVWGNDIPTLHGAATSSVPDAAALTTSCTGGTVKLKVQTNFTR